MVLTIVVAWGCGTPPGQPRRDEQPVAPDQVLEFNRLYAENCAGCHGPEGRGGAAIALANPVYLAVVDDARIRDVVARGVAGTTMPAFAERAGGMLTDKQIDAIAGGIRSRWSRPGVLEGANPPPYAATSAGNAPRGEAVYRTFCESCHRENGKGGPKGSAIMNDSFLALVSDEGLRTIVVTGRPERGAPDWRSYRRGQPMSDQDVSDVVAWLASRRVESPGQPYTTPHDQEP